MSIRTNAAVIAGLALSLAACGSCGSKKSDSGTSMGSASPVTDKVYVQLKDAPDGLDMRVTEGKSGPPSYDHSKLAPAAPLGATTIAQLLTRAKPIKSDADDQKAFALRPRSKPVPRTGNTITQAFPPPASSQLPPKPHADDEGKPLRVLRYMPEGNVPVAPSLSVTFSQPMVAVTSQGDAAGVQPVKLMPQPKGNWRWLGTRTIMFDPDIRFPQATTYTVEVPAGTKSQSGGTLDTATRFSFETPTVTLVSHFPFASQPQHLDVPMFLLFDQKIDAQAVLAMIEVTADGKAVRVRQVDANELAALAKSKKRRDRQLTALVEAAKNNDQDGRWLAIRPASDLPKNASIQVTIPKGTPSAEGPNKTKGDQSFTFRTYAPLEIVRAGCNYGSGVCPPGSAFVVEFNNPLDDDKFDVDQVSVRPDLPGIHVTSGGRAIVIQGQTKARRTYKAVIAKSVTDDFGQTLGKDEVRTWTVGDARPTFYGPSGMVVLDPAKAKNGKPTLDFFSVNYPQLEVKLYKVQPDDLDAYFQFVRNQWNKDHPPPVPGKLVFDHLVKTTSGQNELVETHVDLSSALPKSGLGHVVAIVEPHPWTERYDPPRMISWVQSTRIGIDAHVDANDMVAYASDLATGKPASGVAFEIQPFGIKGTSNDDGLATMPLATASTKGVQRLIARRGDDVALLTANVGYYEYGGYGSWVKSPRGNSLAWYVIDDRKMYKPGEKVSLKGWLRVVDLQKGGDVGSIDDAVSKITYTVKDSRNNEIAKGETQIDATGGFSTTFTLPKTPNLGNAWIDFVAQSRDPWAGGGGSHRHMFQIQEFRRPEFEVSAQPSQGPFLVGGEGDVIVSAKYYAGGALPGAPVNWNVTATPTTFTPPNRDDYTFGSWVPWWGYRGDLDTDRPKSPNTWNLQSKTDATGAQTMHLDFLSIKPAMPMSVQANVSVTDVNRQSWSASSALIVHPSRAYVGLKTERPFVRQGKPFDIDVIGVDLDGKPLADAPIELKAVRLDWEYNKGKYTRKELDPQTCSVASQGADAKGDPTPAHCSFQTAKGGTYEVTATILDKQQRPNQTKLTFWVAGGKQAHRRGVGQEIVQLIPDKKEYAPGDTAEVMIQAPFYPASAIVTWRRSGIVKTERIEITEPTRIIQVPISDAMTPNMYVQVDLVGAAERLDDDGEPDPKLPKRPAYAVGSLDLPVPPKHRTLAVSVTPKADKVAPGETTSVTVEVKDAKGKPVANAETAVIVVDEAILALSNYQFADPIDTFYSLRSPDTRDAYSRRYVILKQPGVVVTASSGPQGAANMRYRGGGRLRRGYDEGEVLDDTVSLDSGAMAATGGEAMPLEESKHELRKADRSPMARPPAKPSPRLHAAFAGADKDVDLPMVPPSGPAIAIRSNFNPLAAFAPAVHTNAAGVATVSFKMPDNLTRYRIVAVAVAGAKQFGKGEQAVTARLPIMVRPSPPRFLNFGDTFQLPVVVQNQTDLPLQIEVAARTTNAKFLGGPTTTAIGRAVAVPPNDRVEVLLPAATEMAGTARFQFVASVGAYSDAAEVEIPVWTPATTEAFATYGVIDDVGGAMAQPVKLPSKVITQFGGLEVTTSSTNLQALTDALLYLVHYPFECAEQRSSRIMGIVGLQDVLTAFHTKDMPSISSMKGSVAEDVKHLSQMQNYDGGFAYWERGRPSDPYLTVYVTNALTRAKDKGYDIPANILQRAQWYLKSIESHYPYYYGPQIRQTISAYALYTRKLMGDLDIAKAQAIYRQYGGATKLNMEANAWLLGTFAGNAQARTERAAIVRHAMNNVSETAGAANFTTSYGDGAYLLLASDRRVDAVMLESLIEEQPKNDLIPKIVTGLLAHRKAGRWLNTQENTFALLAMDKYFHVYEKATPDFVARVWLGNDYAGDHAFKGRSTDSFEIPIPMKDVATHDNQALTIQKDGVGRLYYRIGMTYAPASLKLDPADYGFVVTRTYEGADDPKDVTRAKDGTWHVKAGARVRVKLNMVNENRRYHVALVDPMPAGFEAMNPALAVTGPIPADPKQQQSRGRYWWWYGPWYEHQNLRDERVEAFASLLWEGVHTYEYVARATTPGNFVVPPPKAEEMYMPETFGRGGSDRVIVE